ncbi:MAG: TIGR03936 family radical SAM-associated protein [Firmicutes bacterium]|nr:TIGR03936 family radical SAM-associated protein [Bacillota bacterium]
MKKVRMKFCKYGKMKFVGHLDLLKLFQRAVKRAGIPIAYSKGFNPHQIMSFAIPLPVGTESYGEYVDMRLEGDMENEEIKERLNKTLPIGMQMTDIREHEENEKNAAAVIAAALYEIELDREIKDIEKIISSEEMFIEKQGKKGIKTVNIKEDIFSAESFSENGKTVIKTLIATGSRRNLKPNLVAEYIYKTAGEELKEYRIKYKRIEMYKEDNGKFVTLMQ